MQILPNERRLEPRYTIHGPVAVRPVGLAEFETDIVDLSLNGALLALPENAPLREQLLAGLQVELEISLQGVPHVVARARIAHIQNGCFGLEFSDMETHDFDVFSGLVLMLEQRQRVNWAESSS